MDVNIDALKKNRRPNGMPFRIAKLGHIVLNVSDLDRSVRFYTQVLGLEVSDVYPEGMMPGGMVFLRFNSDHHGVALVGALEEGSDRIDLHHVAFEVGTLEEVLRARDYLHEMKVPVDFEGRRRAGCQIAVEFRDPDGHRLEIYWGVDQVGSNGVTRPPAEWKGAKSLDQAIAEPAVGQDTSVHGYVRPGK